MNLLNNREKKVTVSIYCKIYCDNYPEFEGEKTGNEIVEHLLSDCGCIFEEDNSLISGDLCIWYLGTNEKFGSIYLQINDQLQKEWKWNFGESNFKIVEEFVDVLKTYEIITEEQYDKLKDATKIGKTLGDMYQIENYLKCINEGKKWIPKITNTKEQMKNLVSVVKKKFEDSGYYEYSKGDK